MNAAQRAIFLEVSTVNISGVRGLRIAWGRNTAKILETASGDPDRFCANELTANRKRVRSLTAFRSISSDGTC